MRGYTNPRRPHKLPQNSFHYFSYFFSCVVYVLSQKKRGRNREKKKNFYWKMGAATLLCPIESRGPNTRRDLARYVQCISFGFRVRAQKGTAQNLPRPVNNPFTILFRLFFFFFFFLLRTGDCIHIYWFHYFPHTLLLADLWLTDFFRCLSIIIKLHFASTHLTIEEKNFIFIVKRLCRVYYFTPNAFSSFLHLYRQLDGGAQPLYLVACGRSCVQQQNGTILTHWDRTWWLRLMDVSPTHKNSPAQQSADKRSTRTG